MPAISYYLGSVEDARETLQRIMHQLQIEGGLLARVPKPEVEEILYLADRWTDEKLRAHYEVPFRKILIPVPDAEGGISEVEEFPPAVQEISAWRAVKILMDSLYGENQPNKSEAAQASEAKAEELVLEARHRIKMRTGPGRKKHPNPFMPPEIAPMVNDEKNDL